jgi:hypothetical protein
MLHVKWVYYIPNAFIAERLAIGIWVEERNLYYPVKRHKYAFTSEENARIKLITRRLQANNLNVGESLVFGGISELPDGPIEDSLALFYPEYF